MILDLFSGLNGWTSAFKGDEIISLDFLPKFNPTICTDILKWDYKNSGYKFEVIFASPPCECFSVASIGKYWAKDPLGEHTPKTDASKNAIQILEKTIEIIKHFNPRYFFIENPRGMMRNMKCLKEFERVTVTYCQYGEKRMKPTDIWGVFPDDWFPKPPCKNGDACHERAPRGARTGTQGIKGSALRAVIPTGLSEEIRKAIE